MRHTNNGNDMIRFVVVVVAVTTTVAATEAIRRLEPPHGKRGGRTCI